MFRFSDIHCLRYKHSRKLKCYYSIPEYMTSQSSHYVNLTAVYTVCSFHLRFRKSTASVENLFMYFFKIYYIEANARSFMEY